MASTAAYWQEYNYTFGNIMKTVDFIKKCEKFRSYTILAGINNLANKTHTGFLKILLISNLCKITVFQRRTVQVYSEVNTTMFDGAYSQVNA